MAVFVVRGIMDVLEPVPNEPDLAEATDMVRAYLERLCPVEAKSDRYVLPNLERHGLPFLGNLDNPQGKRRSYFVRLDHIRRYRKDNAERPGQETA